MTQNTMLERGAGILMPISSLPSPYGIGTFGKAAYEFADALVRARQKYWQVLPMGPTSYGDSPYQGFSAFAGNPYFIDLDMLQEEGLLTREEIGAAQFGMQPERVSYDLLYLGRFTLLAKACARSSHKETEEYRAFEEEQAFWLDDYALYMAVKKHFGDRAWRDWDDHDIKAGLPAARESYRNRLAAQVDYWKFIQFKFFQQWKKLRDYVNGLGIRIIGDIPLYLSMDSADVWSHKEFFQMDKRTLDPTEVAGVPPDLFSETGQLWGNPLYNWSRMEKDGFRWWRERMKANARLYDAIRIDHFIGISKYYAIPYGETTALNGHYKKGPGAKLTNAINQTLAEYGTRVIAEDLGVPVPESQELLRKMGYPGMRVIEFAFGGDRMNPHLPHCYVPNSVVYGGTHDNEPMAAYFDAEARPWWEMQFICDYLGTENGDQVIDKVFRAAYGSVASVAIFQMQDVLGLDGRSRMNTPGQGGGNWQWRMLPGEFSDRRTAYLAKLCDIYGR